MDNKIFIQGISLIETAIQKEFTEQQITLYRMLLEDINEKQFIDGIVRLLKERVYTNIPAPAEIREYCLELKQTDYDFKIAEARNKIKKAISGCGSYRNVCFDDPIIHAIIKSFGGWIKICSSDIDEFNDFLKWELPKLYKTYSTRKIEVDLFLTGITYNQKDKVQIEYIGDPETIKRWHTSYIAKREKQLELKERIKAEQLGITGVLTIEDKRMNLNEIIEKSRFEL